MDTEGQLAGCGTLGVSDWSVWLLGVSDWSVGSWGSVIGRCGSWGSVSVTW